MQKRLIPLQIKRKRKDIHCPTYSERLQIRMKDHESIDYLCKLFNFSYYKEKKTKMYVLNVNDKKAITIIKAVYPYLKIKRKQAELLFKLRKSKESKKGRTRGGPKAKKMDKSIIEEREELFQQCKKLNSG